MKETIKFPTTEEVSPIDLEEGEVLFVLGANGSGKSNLMHHIYTHASGPAELITALRQTWLPTDILDLTAKSKADTERNMRDADKNIFSISRDVYSNSRTKITVSKIVDAEIDRALKIAEAYDTGDCELISKINELYPSPLVELNQIFMNSNIDIKLKLDGNEKLLASKEGSEYFNATRLSDGERNVLFLAGDVLTANPHSLILIDEPERHLHRSIISLLLWQLIESRKKCNFVISTHDHILPIEKPNSKVLLLRSCNYGKDGSTVAQWDADLLPEMNEEYEKIKIDLVGARRNIIYVEGKESSLDKKLYELIFPSATVISVGNCRNVVNAVRNVKEQKNLHWLEAFGIVDGDGSEEDAGYDHDKRIYTLNFYSIESIYYHKVIIECVSKLQTEIHGGVPEELAKNAILEALSKINENIDHLSEKYAKHVATESIISEIRNDTELLEKTNVKYENRYRELLSKRKEKIRESVSREDWEAILKICPIRESQALDEIASKLKFQRRSDYENAVIQKLKVEEGFRIIVRDLFGELIEQIPK